MMLATEAHPRVPVRGATGSVLVFIVACLLVAGLAALAIIGLGQRAEQPTVGGAPVLTGGGSPPPATGPAVGGGSDAPGGVPAGEGPAGEGPAGEGPAGERPAEEGTAVAVTEPEVVPAGGAVKEDWPPKGHDDDPSELDSFGTSHLPACGEGWYTNDIAKGEASARRLGVPLLLIFEKEKCKHCRHFSNVQLADPELVAVMKSKKLVVVKRFYDQWDKQNHSIRATPTFKAMEWRGNDWVMTEYLPGLLELPLMRKRISDIAAGRGRLDRQRKALAADPEDIDALKILLDEYLEIFPPRQKIDMVEKGLRLDPAWTHGIAMKIFILSDLEKQGMTSAKRMLEEYIGAAQARLSKSAGGALDYFTVGYYELTTGQHAAGVRNLERSLEIDKTDCEVLSHLSFGYVTMAGLSKLENDVDKAVEYMIKAETTVNRALGYCPDSALATVRKQYIEAQWDAMELPRKK